MTDLDSNDERKNSIRPVANRIVAAIVVAVLIAGVALWLLFKPVDSDRSLIGQTQQQVAATQSLSMNIILPGLSSRPDGKACFLQDGRCRFEAPDGV